MRLRDFVELVLLLALAATVAVVGEPRPLALIVGGAAALSIVFAAARKLDQ